MAILRLCIVPTKALINGKHKVRISLAHNSGKLVFGKYKTFGQCYSVVSHKMEEFTKIAGIEKRVIYLFHAYSYYHK